QIDLVIFRKDAVAHPQIGDGNGAGNGTNLGDVDPEEAGEREGCEQCGGKPEKSIVAEDAQAGDQGEACELAVSGTGALLKGPELVPAEAIDRPDQVGQGIIDDEQAVILRRQPQHQQVKDQYIHEGVQPSYQTKAQHLCKQLRQTAFCRNDGYFDSR